MYLTRYSDCPTGFHEQHLTLYRSHTDLKKMSSAITITVSVAVQNDWRLLALALLHWLLFSLSRMLEQNVCCAKSPVTGLLSTILPIMTDVVNSVTELQALKSKYSCQNGRQHCTSVYP